MDCCMERTIKKSQLTEKYGDNLDLVYFDFNLRLNGSFDKL